MDYQVDAITGNIDIVPLEDFHFLSTFYSGVESIDILFKVISV